MVDSGAVFTTETIRNSELKNAIFTIFALKLVELSSIKGLANNCENKALLWRNFKNSFAWFIGMKKVIFGFNNFFGSGHFLIHDFWKKWSKNDRSQKNFLHTKISFLIHFECTKEFFKFMLTFTILRQNFDRA